MAGRIGQHNPEAQLGKHRMPKRIILVNIKRARNSHRSVGRFRLAEGFVIENTLQLIIKQIRHVVFARNAASLFAAVPRNKFPAVLKGRNRKHAPVLALSAPREASLIGKTPELLTGYNPGPLAFHFLFCKQRRAERAHKLRNIRPDDFPPELQFKGAQNRVVLKGPSLHDDIFAKVLGVLDLDYLIQRVLYNRIGKPGRDIPHRRSFLLRLLYAAVHEYGTACSEIDRIPRLKRLLRKFLNRYAERKRKGLQETPASRGTRFIQHDSIYNAILNPQAFHVLPADIDDKVNILVKKFRRLIMRHCLNLSKIEFQRFFYDCFSVACNARACDIGILRNFSVNITYNFYRGIKRIPLV
ncbi:MAG: hypothetical protein DELT_03141 [Desulfovibrio sp.]